MRSFKHRRRGNTWITLLVIMVIFGVLVAILLPQINLLREGARKSGCGMNLKQIGYALTTYEAIYRTFPSGARVRTDRKTNQWTGDWGASWWVAIMPFAERNAVGRRFGGDHDQFSHLIMDNTIQADGLDVDDYCPSFMQCPSSPLPARIILPNPLLRTPTSVMLPVPTYAGISGTVPDPPPIYNNPPPPAVRPPDWRPHWLPNPPSVTLTIPGSQLRCTSQANPEGSVGGNGAFPPHRAMTIAALRDGLSMIVFVGEQSDYGTDATAGDALIDIRSCSWYGAWLGLGNTGNQNIADTDSTVPGTITPYNCTTIAFPVNSKIRQSTSSERQNQITIPGLVGHAAGTLQPAWPRGLGNNNGIQSAHEGGANVLYGDGRVSFLDEKMELRILLSIGCRDDLHLIPW